MSESEDNQRRACDEAFKKFMMENPEVKKKIEEGNRLFEEYRKTDPELKNYPPPGMKPMSAKVIISKKNPSDIKIIWNELNDEELAKTVEMTKKLFGVKSQST